MANVVIQHLLEEIEEGIENFRNSEEYINFLNFNSHFKSYTFNNRMLIYLQKPNASYVASFNNWKKLKRYPRKGTGIKILAPLMRSKKDSKNNIVDDEPEVYGYKYVNVYDISDTYGEDLPNMNIYEEYSEESYNLDTSRWVELFTELTSCEVIFSESLKSRGIDGYFNKQTNLISIDNSLKGERLLSVLVHEIAHSILHSKERQLEEVMTTKRKELEAESVAYCVGRMLGLENVKSSFSYITAYIKSESIENVKITLNNIINVVRLFQKTINEEVKNDNKSVINV